MVKKVISILFVMITACALVFSSGSKDETTETGKTEISICWWGNQVRNDRTQKVLEMYEEEHPDVAIEGQFLADYWQRLATLAAGHAMPDVIQMDYSIIAQYINNGLLVDLAPYIESGVLNLDDVSPTIIDTARVGDSIYGVCNGVNAPAMLYNKTLTDSLGITIKDNMTIDEFIDISRKIYAETGYKTSFVYGGDVDDQYLNYYLRGEGLYLYDDDGLAVGVEDLLPFFQIFEQGINEGWQVSANVYVERQRGTVEQDCLVYGSSPDTMSWCAFYHSNQMVATQNAAPDGMEIGITTWPSPNPALSNFLKPSQFFCVSIDSKNPEIGASLIDYITNSVDANNVLLGERGIPASSVVAKAISPNQSEIDQIVSAYINDVVTPNCSPIDPPFPDYAPQVDKVIEQLTEKVLYGRITAEEAANQLFTEGNAIAKSK